MLATRCTWSSTRWVRSTVAPGGVVTLMYTMPWSSLGMKPVGRIRLTPQVAAKKNSSMATVITRREASVRTSPW